MTKLLLLLLLAQTALLPAQKAMQEEKTSSRLWGENGELWDPRGRLPDFSYAGYDAGNSSIPVFTNVVNVLDYGAIKDDTISDVSGILDAIAAAPESSVIYFPAGKYVIDTTLLINKSKLVLKGDGDHEGGTVFYLPNSATEANGTYQGSYSAGDYGHLIKFYGGFLGARSLIVENADRGDRTVTVDDPMDLKVGDVIAINATGDNPANGELWHEYHNNQSKNWDCTEVWATGNGGSMFHRIERIEGNLITFQEALRLKIKPSWNMKIYTQTPGLENVGFEDIRVEFIETEHTGHLDEPGYNAIQFNHCRDFWCRNVSINHCDNGIYIKGSAYGEIENISFLGREGHHAIKIAYSANNLVTGINFQTNLPYTHSVTFIHKANGNVLRNVSGTQSISLDFHRNAPFSNLICDVRSEWTHESSGAVCAGPHGGARNVYWGLFGAADAIKWRFETWGHFQNTLVSELAVNEAFTSDRQWYEDVPDLVEKDLYESQHKFRLNAKTETIFSENEYGDRGDWFERDPSRWKVEGVEGESYYSLHLDEIPELSKGKVAEYSLFQEYNEGTFEISARAKYPDTIQNREEVDFVLLASYINDDNYIFGRVSSNKYKSGIFSVVNGTASLLMPGLYSLSANEEHEIKMSLQGNLMSLIMNDTLVASTQLSQPVTPGIFGIGSTKNSVLFDNISISDTVSEYIISSIAEIAVEDNEILVYPNPVSDLLSIEADGQAISYKVLNLRGSIIASGIDNEIDFTTFEEGVYCIAIETQGGKNQYIKVVKAK